MEWLKATLQTYPELAVFLAICIGYWVGSKAFKGFSLGAVTSTLLAAIIIGQWDIQVSATVKSVFFLLFLFAVGYGIGPQFVRGIAKDGVPQALFSVLQCLLCLAFPIIAAVIAGYDLGSAAGLFAGSQTISASMGLATDAINRLGLPAEQAHATLSAMPVAYAVTYVFGTVGSAVLLAQVMPKIMGINLVDACKDYEEKFGGSSAAGDGVSWHQYELRAYKLGEGNCATGLPMQEFEKQFPGRRVFLEGLRRNGKVLDIDTETTLQVGDILGIGGDHAAVIQYFDNDACYTEVDDPQLTGLPVTGVDVFVTSKEVDGKTLAELGQRPNAHGIFLRRIKRGAAGTEIPLLPNTQLHRGDVITLFGPEKDLNRAVKNLGVVDKKSAVADVAFLAGGIVIGALIGSLVFKFGGVPITLSTAGGTLIAGLICGWLRSIHPTFGYIPEPTIWFMNSFGLNVFIAVIGLSAGPNFISGLQQLGISLFLWGVFATLAPLICGAYLGKYVFKFHPALLFGCCAGARTTTAAIGMINDQAKSTIPSLGYTVTYAVGNTLLTMWGLVLIMILS